MLSAVSGKRVIAEQLEANLSPSARREKAMRLGISVEGTPTAVYSFQIYEVASETGLQMFHFELSFLDLDEMKPYRIGMPLTPGRCLKC